jgi:hypothetical protein
MVLAQVAGYSQTAIGHEAVDDRRPFYFRTVGVIVPREYLQRLLSADSLAERYDMDGSARGQSSLVYSKMLAGTSWDVQRPALLDVADQPKRSGTLVAQDGEVGDEDGDDDGYGPRARHHQQHIKQ